MRFVRRNPWAFLAVPVLFALVALALLWGVGSRVLKPYLGLASYLMSDETAQAESESEPLFSDSFVPTEGQSMPEPDTRTSVPRSSIDYPDYDEQFGTVTVEGTEVFCPLFRGDSEIALGAGAGTVTNYDNVGLPGMGATVMITGYNNTVFRDLENVAVGSRVALQTHYGTYLYEITGTAVADNDDASAADTSGTEEKLILYTGYPFGSLGTTKQRFYVYGRFLSGPVIDYSE